MLSGRARRRTRDGTAGAGAAEPRAASRAISGGRRQQVRQQAPTGRASTRMRPTPHRAGRSASCSRRLVPMQLHLRLQRRRLRPTLPLLALATLAAADGRIGQRGRAKGRLNPGKARQRPTTDSPRARADRIRPRTDRYRFAASCAGRPPSRAAMCSGRVALHHRTAPRPCRRRHTRCRRGTSHRGLLLIILLTPPGPLDGCRIPRCLHPSPQRAWRRCPSKRGGGAVGRAPEGARPRKARRRASFEKRTRSVALLSSSQVSLC